MTAVDRLLVQLFRPPRFLIVADDNSALEHLLHEHYVCGLDRAKTASEIAVRLAQAHYDLAVLDLALLNGQGDAALTLIMENCPALPLALVRTANTDLDAVLAKVQLATLLDWPITLPVLQRLFSIFRIKVPTRAIAAYCAQLEQTVGAQQPMSAAMS